MVHTILLDQAINNGGGSCLFGILIEVEVIIVICYPQT
jgi:hypothetical protein